MGLEWSEPLHKRCEKPTIDSSPQPSPSSLHFIPSFILPTPTLSFFHSLLHSSSLYPFFPPSYPSPSLQSTAFTSMLASFLPSLSSSLLSLLLLPPPPSLPYSFHPLPLAFQYKTPSSPLTSFFIPSFRHPSPLTVTCSLLLSHSALKPVPPPLSDTSPTPYPQTLPDPPSPPRPSLHSANGLHNVANTDFLNFSYKKSRMSNLSFS